METKLIYCAFNHQTEHAVVNAIHLVPIVQRVDSAVNLLNNCRLDGKSCSYKNYIFISYYIPRVFGYFFCLNDMSHDVFYHLMATNLCI